MDKEAIKILFDANRLDEAEAALGTSVEAWAVYMRGRIAWRRGRKGEAISLYEKALAIDPGCEAAVALEQARSVMNFFNKDLLNP
ncbi:MAG: tetratricopeptide repeat protein [Muribaculaceae bacterium]|nr:tetratricopeptide repeat protein [Muribaculaceae bacterium]